MTATLAACAPSARAIHGRCPGVETTVFRAIGVGVFVAPASRIRGIVAIDKGNASVIVIQILRHPRLGTDGHGLIGSAVAFVRHGTLNYS